MLVAKGTRRVDAVLLSMRFSVSEVCPLEVLKYIPE